MKAKFYCSVFVLLLFHCISLAQTPNLQLSSNNGNQSYVQAFENASENLLESRIPYGVLYDKVFGWAGMSIWQSGDTTSKSHLIQTWWDLENSRMNPKGYTFENMKSTTEGLKEQQKISLLSFNYNFGYIDTMAYYDGRMQVVNNELVDAGGASPYIVKNVTLSGLSVDEATAGTSYTLQSSLSFMLVNNTQHSITGYTISNITSGAQYSLSTNSTLPISFSAPGLNYLHITTQTTAGSFISVQVINVQQNNQVMFRTAAMQSTAAPVHELLASDIAFQGYDESTATTSYADFHIYYHYANSGDTNTSERVLRKPLLMIDGFDAGDGRNYEEIYYDMLAYSGGHLGKELRKKGYDLIILNFPVAGTKSDEQGKTNIDIPLINGNRRDGGTDYIERNAFLLVKLIQTLNERLRQNGSNEKLVIVGPSMGGQISRYALAYMEKKEAEGFANMKHNTKLWISFDSPHEGANIPLAGQRSMIYLGFITGNQEARQNYFSKLGNPASKQMLIEQFDIASYDNGSSYDYTIIPRQNGSSPFHQTYYNNLKINGVSGSNGWPTQLKKIALLNGSGNGNKIWSENQEFLNVVGRVTFLNIRVLGMYCNFMPIYGQNNRIFRGWRSFNFEDDFYVTNINPKGSMDNVPGGLFNTAKELQEGYNEGFAKVRPIEVKPLWNTLLENNSFIPTISALGFKNSNFDWSLQ